MRPYSLISRRIEAATLLLRSGAKVAPFSRCSERQKVDVDVVDAVDEASERASPLSSSKKRLMRRCVTSSSGFVSRRCWLSRRRVSWRLAGSVSEPARRNGSTTPTPTPLVWWTDATVNQRNVKRGEEESGQESGESWTRSNLREKRRIHISPSDTLQLARWVVSSITWAMLHTVAYTVIINQAMGYTRHGQIVN